MGFKSQLVRNNNSSLLWSSLKSLVTEPCLQETEGKPGDSRWKGICSWDTLLAGTRGEGENWIPRCAGVITACSHILICIPVAGPGANHTTPFPFSSKHPDYLNYLQINTWPQAGKRQKVQWCLDPLSLQQHMYLLLKCPILLIKGKRLALKLATTPPEANSSRTSYSQPILDCLWVVIKTLAAQYFSLYPVHCKHYNH